MKYSGQMIFCFRQSLSFGIYSVFLILLPLQSSVADEGVLPFLSNNEFLSVPQEELQDLAHEVMRKNCNSCHGSGTQKPRGGFGFIDDLNRLVLTPEYIVPGYADRSSLVIKVLKDEMPDGAAYGVEDPVSVKEKKVLVAWVQNLKKQENKRAFVDEKDIATSILSDLKTLPPGQRENTRYLTLTHYYNYGVSQSKIRLFLEGLVKLINSLSWSKGHIPKVIGKNRTILRINLDDLGWSASHWDIWETLVSAYPYDLSSFGLPSGVFEEMTGTRLPYLRGDWFAFETSKPPRYYDILNLPWTERDLELTSNLVRKRLGIDVSFNIDSGQVARAGFQVSGVSTNNRLIERHSSPFGAYWKSYDFKKDQGDGSRVLFSSPLGPNEVSGFDHDGGEIIFNLPNGLQAYFLSDSNGRRLDKGPTDIVQDNTRDDRVVHNGISCMSCHADGMRRAEDEIRYYVGNTNIFPEAVVKRVNQLHPSQSDFDKLLDRDIKTFHDAQKKLGLDPTLRDENGLEPISSLVYDFEAPVRVERTAAELNLPLATFKLLLDEHPELEALTLRLGKAGVPRHEFIDFFNVFIHGRSIKRDLRVNEIGNRGGSDQYKEKIADKNEEDSERESLYPLPYTRKPFVP